MSQKKRRRPNTPKYTVVGYEDGKNLYLGRNEGPSGEDMGEYTFFKEDNSIARLKRGQGVPVNQRHIMNNDFFNRFGPTDKGDLSAVDGIDTLNSAALLANTAKIADMEETANIAKNLVAMKHHGDGTKRKKRRKKRTNGKKKKKTKGGRKSRNRRRKTRR